MGGPLVLFDLDGTLVDSGRGITASVGAAADRVGAPRPTPEQMRALIGPPFPHAFVDILGLDEATATAMMEAYRDVYGASGLYDVDVYPGMADLLAGLANAGLPLAVTTSKPEIYASEVLRHVGLADRFDAGIHGATLDGTVEGKAAVVGLALDAHPGVPVVGLVGDRHHDISGAHAHGLTSIGVTWGFGGRSELVEAGARYVVDSPEELADVLTALS